MRPGDCQAVLAGDPVGCHHWKFERSLSWLSCFGRLQVRWDRDSGRWFAFVLLACALVCLSWLYLVRGRSDASDAAWPVPLYASQLE